MSARDADAAPPSPSRGTGSGENTPKKPLKTGNAAISPAIRTSADVGELSKRIIGNVEQAIVGKRKQLVLSLVTWFSGGHILLEDVPGVAKTMLARALARSVGCKFKRVQCTPDLLPTDVTGTSIFNQKKSQFEFRPGPVFTQILLTDEINRATPRTWASLRTHGRHALLWMATPMPQATIHCRYDTNPVDHEGLSLPGST